MAGTSPAMTNESLSTGHPGLNDAALSKAWMAGINPAMTLKRGVSFVVRARLIRTGEMQAHATIKNPVAFLHRFVAESYLFVLVHLEVALVQVAARCRL